MKIDRHDEYVFSNTILLKKTNIVCCSPLSLVTNIVCPLLLNMQTRCQTWVADKVLSGRYMYSLVECGLFGPIVVLN